MEIYKRKSVFAEVKGILSKPGDFIEITEWNNGEGFDVTINSTMFQLTWDQYKLLTKLVKKLKKIQE